MFKVVANVYHSYSSIEHICKFYPDRPSAVRYIGALISTLDEMQSGGTVESYEIQLIREVEVADKC